MLKGGPSLYYLKKMFSNPKNAVFMVSYQAPGTPGRRILEEGVFGEESLPVLARVQWFDFSSHTDQRGIISLLKNIRGLERVILVHGDPTAQEALKKGIMEELGEIPVYAPVNGEKIVLD
jgi:putative mRNA 3-end processing factor